MNFPIAIAALFLATSAAAPPAFAAMPASISLHDTAAIPIETVQYRQAPRQRQHHADGYRNGYNAYASHNGARRRGNNHIDAPLPGWGCVSHGIDSGAYSAYPNWEMCD